MPISGKLVMVGALAVAAIVPVARADGTFAQQKRDPYLAMNRQLVAHGCHFCHGADYARVGPSMKDVAMAYAGNGPAGRAQIRESIMKGTKGHWGPAVMPPQAQVRPQDLDALVAAIMATKDVSGR